MQRLKNQQIAHDENLTPLKTSMTVHNFSGRTATVPDYMFSKIYSSASVGILLGVLPKEIVIYM